MKSAVFVLVLGALCAAEKVHQTKPERTEKLECGISDKRSILKWLKGDELLFNIDLKSGRKSKVSGNTGIKDIVSRSRLIDDSNLQISKIDRQDAGRFTCSLNGQEEHHRLVVASVSVSPSTHLEAGSEAVLQCDVAGLPQGETVEWVSPGGGRQQTPTLTINSVTTEHAGNWECVFSAHGHSMKETVSLTVTEADTKAIPSNTTPQPNFTTETPEGTLSSCLDCDSPTRGPPGLLGLSWWVWAAVGGGCLVLLLWVLILVIYMRMMRRKRRFMKMRNAAQSRPKQYCQCPAGPTAVAGHRGKKPSAPPFSAPVRTVL